GIDPNPKPQAQNPKSDPLCHEPETDEEQVRDRSATGLPATKPISIPSLPASSAPPEPANPPDASPDPADADPAPPTVRCYPAWSAAPSAPIGSPSSGFSPFR